MYTKMKMTLCAVLRAKSDACLRLPNDIIIAVQISLIVVRKRESK